MKRAGVKEDERKRVIVLQTSVHVYKHPEFKLKLILFSLRQSYLLQLLLYYHFFFLE